MLQVESNSKPEHIKPKYLGLVDTLRIFIDKHYFVPDPQRADAYLHSDHSRNWSSGDVHIPIGM